jgi:hypothetical protein
LANAAADRLHGEVEARKSPIVGQARSVSSALDRAASELGDGQGAQWLKSAFEQGAQQIQRLADTVEQKDSRQLADAVRQFARDNPSTFLMACAAAGFAASRVFRAEPPVAQTPDLSQTWNDSGAANPTGIHDVPPAPTMPGGLAGGSL